MLNLHQDEYLENFEDTVGARILVHDQGIMPFPEDEGIIVGPGKATSVGIRKVSWNGVSCGSKRCDV